MEYAGKSYKIKCRVCRTEFAAHMPSDGHDHEACSEARARQFAKKLPVMGFVVSPTMYGCEIASEITPLKVEYRYV
jgi:hypothetical protein